MKKKNKFLAIIVVLALLMSFTIHPAYAAEIVVAGSDCAALQSAIDGAASGDTVKLNGDVDMLDGTLTIAADDDIILDLNGHTIAGSSAATNHAMIRNNGMLTITGNGVITYEFTGTPDSTYGSGNYTIVNGGVMVVENGLIANTTAAMSHCFITIDNNSTSRDVSLTVNGGTIVSDNYRSVRQFANSTTRKNELVINGGEFVGQIWTQSTNANANLASVEINGGTFKPAGPDASSIFIETASNGDFEVEVTGGYFETKIGASNPTALEGAIVGGTFTEQAKNGTNTALFSDACELKDNGDGTFTSTRTDVIDESTIVTYVGQGVEEYEIQVPATLTPGETGDIKVSGTWASNRKLTVGVPEKVTLNHSFNKADTKVLDVVFSGIEKAGDNCFAVSADGTISVSDIADALFGTWKGTIVYTVTFSDAS